MTRRYACLMLLLCVCLTSCIDQKTKEERLAKQYCSSCHLYPDPNLLDKKSWDKVINHMAFLMGHEDMETLMQMSDEDRSIVIPLLPRQPIISDEDLAAIRNFYSREAPDSLKHAKSSDSEVLSQFDVTPFRLPVNTPPLVTLIHHDSIRRKIYIGTRYSRLYEFNDDLKLKDSFQLRSPVADMFIPPSGNPLLLEMGIMDPNDASKGQLIQLRDNKTPEAIVIDSLKRPVNFNQVHLNKDTLVDYVVCAFGNYSGALLAFEQRENGTYKRHILQPMPGARNVIVQDFDGNGLQDILVLMTQGDEKILLLYNQGNFKFRITTLLRFPPVYGSSYFDIADFNNDGKFDILYTNGDNADFSMILKPYHGIRIFLNDGTNQFTEDTFLPMYGASKALARDFDNDGDMDVAAISFFPDFKDHSEEGFLYFEKRPEGFVKHSTPLASHGRWLVMEAFDIDHDDDEDLVLGALNFPTQVPSELFQDWSSKKESLLIFRNKSH